MNELARWTRSRHAADAITRDTYRKGTGPGVVLIHELPGITPNVIAFAEEVVARGYTVVLPHLFGTPEAPATPSQLATSFARVCINREFTKIALGETTPVAGWLRSLARELHGELGGPGVGALGMCFTGGYALAMMVDAPVVAPVVCQPSTPFAIGKARAASVNLSARDLEIVKQRAAAGCAVLGLRYRHDGATGTRFDTLRTELGDNFAAIEFEGRGHSVVTEHRQQQAVDAILDFFDDRLAG
ncbi:MAG: dienelactone hydrolase family protein [Nocardioidaceae bacterium]